jgi:hypothetical protein
MRITQFVKKKAPSLPARGLKYEILAFIRTKNVDKLERKRPKNGTVQPTCQNKAVEVLAAEIILENCKLYMCTMNG